LWSRVKVLLSLQSEIRNAHAQTSLLRLRSCAFHKVY
jgi:hypothetical protein